MGGRARSNGRAVAEGPVEDDDDDDDDDFDDDFDDGDGGGGMRSRHKIRGVRVAREEKREREGGEEGKRERDQTMTRPGKRWASSDARSEECEDRCAARRGR